MHITILILSVWLLFVCLTLACWPWPLSYTEDRKPSLHCAAWVDQEAVTLAPTARVLMPRTMRRYVAGLTYRSRTAGKNSGKNP